MQWLLQLLANPIMISDQTIPTPFTWTNHAVPNITRFLSISQLFNKHNNNTIEGKVLAIANLN